MSTPRIIIEGYPADQAAAIGSTLTAEQPAPSESTTLIEWLEEQAADESLEQSMFSGTMDKSPFQQLMAELIRRAHG